MDHRDLKPTVGDHLHVITRAGLSTLPMIGGPIVEIFNAVITPPLVKRRDSFLQSIAEDVKNLENKVNGFKIEQLADNEVFITTVLHATQIALRTHKQDKISALRNVIIHSTSITEDNLDKMSFYLNMIDTLTALHIQVLYLLSDRASWLEKHNKSLHTMNTGSIWELLDYAFGLLSKNNRDIFSQVLKDLYSYGFTRQDLSQVTAVINSILLATTTELAKDFMSFITSPIQLIDNE